MAITIDDIEALRRTLAELPPHQPREVSKQDAIALLATELGAARRRGYSPDELAQLLSEQGVTINAATLRGYLRKNRRPRSKRTRSAAVGGKVTTPAITARREAAAVTMGSAPPPTGGRSAAAPTKEASAGLAKDTSSAQVAKDGTSVGR